MEAGNTLGEPNSALLHCQYAINKKAVKYQTLSGFCSRFFLSPTTAMNGNPSTTFNKFSNMALTVTTPQSGALQPGEPDGVFISYDYREKVPKIFFIRR